MKSVFTYILFYKPYNVLTRFTKDKAEQLSLADFLDVDADVYPVGRLDADSEGLLLLTNDKKLTTLVLEPSSRKNKTYWVQVDGQIHDEAIRKLKNGIEITVDHKKYTTKPCIAQQMTQPPGLPPRNPPVRFRKNIPTSWISITVQEGKNRQIRKMCAAAGFPVLRLVRTKIGELCLGHLKPGKHVKCSREMIYQALSLTAGQPAPPVRPIKKSQINPVKKGNLSKSKKKPA